MSRQSVVVDKVAVFSKPSGDYIVVVASFGSLVDRHELITCLFE
jgi:hypothetical protein